jgi:ribonuclease P protein component
LHYLPNPFPYSRFAVSASAKIGKAVQRNYIKRKMTECFRMNQHLLPRGYDLWISVKKAFDRESGGKAEELFLAALAHIAQTR